MIHNYNIIERVGRDKQYYSMVRKSSVLEERESETSGNETIQYQQQLHHYLPTGQVASRHYILLGVMSACGRQKITQSSHNNMMCDNTKWTIP